MVNKDYHYAAVCRYNNVYLPISVSTSSAFKCVLLVSAKLQLLAPFISSPARLAVVPHNMCLTPRPPPPRTNRLNNPAFCATLQ